MKIKGSGFVIVMILVALMSLVIFIAFSFLESGRTVHKDLLLKKETSYIAESGLEYALLKLSRGEIPGKQIMQFGGGSFEIEYDGVNGKLISKAIGRTLRHVEEIVYSVEVPTLRGFNQCLRIYDENSLFPEQKKVQNIEVRNLCDVDVEIEAISIKCRAKKGYGKIVKLQVDGKNIFFDSDGKRCNKAISAPGLKVRSCDKIQIDLIEFNNKIRPASIGLRIKVKNSGEISKDISGFKQ